MNQDTSRQHFVPKFYLRRFVNADNELEVLDVATETIVESIGPKGVAYEEYFYGIKTGEPDEISQQIENFFRSQESFIGRKYDELVNKIITHDLLSESDKWTIALLMSMLWIRGPAMRDMINNMAESMMKQTNAILAGLPGLEQNFDELDKTTGETTSKEAREKVRKMMREKSYRVTFDNAYHISMFNHAKNFANLFYGQHWLVYISKCHKKFITTDNPVTVVLPETKAFWGPTFLERTHIFPFFPDILIVAREPKSGKHFKRKTIFNDEDAEIIRWNVAAGLQAHKSVFAKDKRDIEDFKRGLVAFKQFALKKQSELGHSEPLSTDRVSSVSSKDNP